MTQLASCPPEFDWAKNSENLDPCDVASRLILRCDNSGQFEGLQTLQSGTSYPVPTNDTANKCTCSSVVYALVSVCSACQNADYSSWPDWSVSCSKVYTPDFPLSSDASIPQWAIFNVQTEPKFDIALAQSSTSPNVTVTPSTTVVNKAATASPTTETISSSAPTSQIQSSTLTDSSISEALTASPHLSTSSETTSTGINPVTQASGADPSTITVADQIQPSTVNTASTRKGSNTGAVAGGTVAGIIVLIIIGSLAFWWIRRHRRSRMAPSAAYMAAYGTARPPTNMSQRPYQGRATSPFVTRADANVPYYDEDFRASAYSDIRQS